MTRQEKAVRLTLDEALLLGGLLFEFWQRNQPPGNREDRAQLETIDTMRRRLIDQHGRAVDDHRQEIVLTINSTEALLLHEFLSLTLSMNEPSNAVGRGMHKRLLAVRDRFEDAL